MKKYLGCDKLNRKMVAVNQVVINLSCARVSNGRPFTSFCLCSILCFKATELPNLCSNELRRSTSNVVATSSYIRTIQQISIIIFNNNFFPTSKDALPYTAKTVWMDICVWVFVIARFRPYRAPSLFQISIYKDVAPTELFSCWLC
jgi:hypothetical protein